MKLRALGLVALTTAAILGMQPAAAQYPDHAVPVIVPSPRRETFAERQKADLACWRMIDDTASRWSDGRADERPLLHRRAGV